MRKVAITALSVCLLAGACTTDGIGTKQGFGTLGGAALGGLGGAQIGKGNGKLAATAAGTLLGAFIGSEIGSSLDKADEMYRQQAMTQAYTAPAGYEVPWENPRSGNRGVIVPQRVGYNSVGQQCREYTQTVYIGGQKESAYGLACQQPDGTWKIVN